MRQVDSWLLAGVVALAVTVCVWFHVGVHAPQPHGVHGDEYVEHAHRLLIARSVQEGGLGDPLELFRLADNDFPPGIHLFGVPLGFVFGHGAERIVWTWIGWVALLGAALSRVVASMGVGRAGRAAAFGSAFLLPALPASATRYHFDLPMVALIWSAVAAALATWDRAEPRSRLRGGALAGVLAWGAMLMKWTAAPFLVAFLGAVWLRPAPGWAVAVRRRSLALGAAVGVAAPLVLGVLDVSSESLDTMSLTFTQGASADPASSVVAGAVRAVGRALARIPEQAPFLKEWLAFYSLAFLTMVVSPAVALVAALASLRWLWSDRRGLGFVLLGAGGGLAFLSFAVPIADSRFLLPLVPMLALTAVLGWSSLARPIRGAMGLLACVVGLGVAADFHLANTPDAEPIPYVNLGLGGSGTVMHRGAGLASSTNDRGWVRRDEALPQRLAFRDALWDAWAVCGPPLVALEQDLVSFGADRYWWHYRAALERLEGRASEGDAWPSSIDSCELAEESGQRADLLFVRAATEADQRGPACLGSPVDGFRRVGFVPDPDGGGGAAVYARRGSPCESWR